MYVYTYYRGVPFTHLLGHYLQARNTPISLKATMYQKDPGDTGH